MQGTIDLGDLRLILMIAAEGSLTGAARRLGIDHSSAFRRLGGLERRLGVRLFLRARDGYTPTPAGEAAATAAAPIVGAILDLERQLAGQDLRPAGTVRVTTTDTLVDLLMPLIAGFRQHHPEIRIELVTANAFFTLTRRDADVAIRAAPAAPEGLVARRLAGVATAIYGARGSPGQDAAALLESGWVGLDDSLSHLPSARWMAAELPDTAIVGRANSLLALAAAVRAGLGLAPLPCFLGDPDPALRRLAPPVPALAVSLWLITHPDLTRVPRVRAFLDWIAPRLADHRPLLEGQSEPN